MSDSERPHRWQPTRLPHPWDSPGKNTGVGCHFLLQCMKVKSESEVAQSCLTPSDSMDCSPPGASIHGIFQARVLEWGAIAFSRFNPSCVFYGTRGFYSLGFLKSRCATFCVICEPLPSKKHCYNLFSQCLTVLNLYMHNLNINKRICLSSMTGFGSKH